MPAKHSKGPFRYERDFLEFPIFSADGVRVAAVYHASGNQGITHGPEEQEANARLFAAAPALLEALEGAHALLLRMIPQMWESDTMTLIEQAMTRAKGE